MVLQVPQEHQDLLDSLVKLETWVRQVYEDFRGRLVQLGHLVPLEHRVVLDWQDYQGQVDRQVQ